MSSRHKIAGLGSYDRDTTTGTSLKISDSALIPSGVSIFLWLVKQIAKSSPARFGTPLGRPGSLAITVLGAPVLPGPWRGKSANVRAWASLPRPASIRQQVLM